MKMNFPLGLPPTGPCCGCELSHDATTWHSPTFDPAPTGVLALQFTHVPTFLPWPKKVGKEETVKHPLGKGLAVNHHPPTPTFPSWAPGTCRTSMIGARTNDGKVVSRHERNHSEICLGHCSYLFCLHPKAGEPLLALGKKAQLPLNPNASSW